MQTILAASNLAAVTLVMSGTTNALTVAWFIVACLWFGSALGTATARFFIGSSEETV